MFAALRLRIIIRYVGVRNFGNVHVDVYRGFVPAQCGDS